MLSEVVTMVVCITKMSHSSKFLPPISSLHYLAHSTEGLMIELGHPVEGTTILFGTQQETQESSLVSPFPSFCFHPILHQAGHFSLKFLSILSPPCYVPHCLVQGTTLVVHTPTGGLSTTLYPLPPPKCFTHGKQS